MIEQTTEVSESPLCEKCGRPLTVDIDVQLANFSLWQRQRGAGYYLWPDEAMNRLRERLNELGAGVEIQPCYAQSVAIKLQTGQVILIGRDCKQI